MKIYKYVTASDLQKILDDGRIAFSHPIDLNDPFDRPRVSRTPYNFTYNSLLDDRLMTPEVQAEDADKFWNECLVSSFTRAPDNALMWAHYAEKHTGAVLEFDAEIACLTNKAFLIPVQYGSVVYMKGRIPDPAPAKGLTAIMAQAVKRGEDRFDIDNFIGLQRLFLTKALPWGYEEEVKAVCEPHPYVWSEGGVSLDGQWKRIFIEKTRELYLYKLPVQSITKVFTGIRFDLVNLERLRFIAEHQGFEIMRSINSNGFEIIFAPDNREE